MKCPECGTKMFKDSDGEYHCPDCEHLIFSKPEKRKPAGCRACGNPDYPDCKYSCPMFDD